MKGIYGIYFRSNEVTDHEHEQLHAVASKLCVLLSVDVQIIEMTSVLR